MNPCDCACHTSAGPYKPTCTVDDGSSGVNGVPYCGAHNLAGEIHSDAEHELSEVCVNGCTERPRDGSPERPAAAEHGRLCARCYRKLRDWLREIDQDYALLATVVTPGSVPAGDGARHTKGAEAPTPVRLDVIALADSDRIETDWIPYHGSAPQAIALDGFGSPARVLVTDPRPVRPAGDELWYEAADIPQVLAVVRTWADELRQELAA